MFLIHKTSQTQKDKNLMFSLIQNLGITYKGHESSDHSGHRCAALVVSGFGVCSSSGGIQGSRHTARTPLTTLSAVPTCTWEWDGAQVCTIAELHPSAFLSGQGLIKSPRLASSLWPSCLSLQCGWNYSCAPLFPSWCIYLQWRKYLLSTVMQLCNPSTWETEIGLGVQSAWTTEFKANLEYIDTPLPKIKIC